MSGLALDPVVLVILRAGLAALLAWSALHKLRDVGAFRSALEGYALLPPLWTVPAGAALIAVEVGLAAALCLPRVGGAAAFGAAALLGLYAAAMAVNLVRGRRDIDCGCGGPAGAQPIGGALVARNALLAAAALASLLPVRWRSLTWIDGLTMVGAVVTLSMLYVAVDGLLRAQRRAGARRSEAADGGMSAYGAADA